jgi:hypothetical protein
MFSGASYDIAYAADAILNGIKALRKNGIPDSDFNRIKNKHIGRYMRSFNNMSSIAGLQAELYPKRLNVFDLMDLFLGLEKKDVYERLELFGADNYCLSVVKNKE